MSRYYTIDSPSNDYGRSRKSINLNIKNIITDALLGFVFLILVVSSWSIVPEGSRGVRTRFSEAVGQTNQGLQFKIPIIESINPISIMAQAVEVKNAEGSTNDTQPVHVDLVVRFHIRENSVLGVYKDFSRTGEMDNYVGTATLEAFKQVTAEYKADQLITKRTEASQKVLSAIQARVNKYGTEIVNIDMTNFAFARDYMTAISQKVTEEQQKLAEQNKLERLKVQNQQQVVQAEAEAQATVATAKVKAEAIRIESQALANNPSLLELRRIEVEKIKAEKWNGQGPTHVLGGVSTFMDLSGSSGKK